MMQRREVFIRTLSVGHTRGDGIGRPPEWTVDGLCAQTDPEAFYPEKGGSPLEAKKVCLKCVVRQTCLEFALENDEVYGIWGGLSERERRKVKRGEPVIVSRTCPGCGKAIPSRGRGTYCKPSCAQSTKDRRRRALKRGAA